MPFELSQLTEMAPHLLKKENRLTRDENKGSWQAWQAVTCGQLIIERKPLAAPSDEVVRDALLSWIREQGLSVLPLNEACEQLLIRQQLANDLFPRFPSGFQPSGRYPRPEHAYCVSPADTSSRPGMPPGPPPVIRLPDALPIRRTE